MAQNEFQQIIDDFDFLEDWEDRYRYIIDLGKKLEPLDSSLKNESTKINGCASQVWMNFELSGSEELSSTETEHTSNGLENFGVEEESAPDLFNSDSMHTESEDLLSTEINEDSFEDDDLEIPAFLRRQKH